jgi:hypothetical protein
MGRRTIEEGKAQTDRSLEGWLTIPLTGKNRR